jgi:REP element-mobilizing transposase RayT
MGYARKSLVCLNDTPYYHVVARCVRRAWLWGFDEYAGRDYSHRKEWILERLSVLTSIFSIEICAFAVMSNHYHLVLYVDKNRAKSLTRAEVAERWTRIFGTPACIRQYLSGEALEAERELAEFMIEQWRERLYDISWFMKSLNEHLARRANAEDDCTGKFWEGRFKSQALLDDAGLLTAMAYVDLNPIRAGIAETPEESEFTSIYSRIRELKSNVKGRRAIEGSVVRLRHFVSGNNRNSAIPFVLHDYLELVDWTGRTIRPGRSGSIDDRLPAIAQRLNIDADAWKHSMRPQGNVFGRAMGKLDHMRLHAITLGQSWVRGLRRSCKLYA